MSPRCVVGQADVAETHELKLWARRTAEVTHFYTTPLIYFVLIIYYYSHLFMQFNAFRHLCRTFGLSYWSIIFSLILSFNISFASFLPGCTGDSSVSVAQIPTAVLLRNFCACRKTLSCCLPIKLFSLQFQPPTAQSARTDIPSIDGNIHHCWT